ncbi:hypothetical protein, partial [Bifidobacterium mongoliense]|uniref:hypothetical protein n=1 Tax=Bifidobacterium mongoliense TaxID=518643 RepID=UPI0026494B2F
YPPHRFPVSGFRFPVSGFQTSDFPVSRLLGNHRFGNTHRMPTTQTGHGVGAPHQTVGSEGIGMKI